MRKYRLRGRFPVEVITEAVAKSELAKKLKAKVKERLARIEPKRLRRWCIVALTMLLLWDVALLVRVGEHRWAGPGFSAIRTVSTVGDQERRPPARSFLATWDSLMLNRETKRAWDSLLKVRPGLSDTLAELGRKDSVVFGK